MNDRPETIEEQMAKLSDGELLSAINATLQKRQGSTTTEAAPPQGSKGSVARGRRMYEAQRHRRAGYDQ